MTGVAAKNSPPLQTNAAARRLGLDPTEIRLRNFIRDGDFPYKSPSGIVWDKASFSLIFIRDQVGNLYDFVDDKVTDAASWTKDNVLTPVMAGLGDIGGAFRDGLEALGDAIRDWPGYSNTCLNPSSTCSNVS